MPSPSTNMPRIDQAYTTPITNASSTTALNMVGTAPLQLLQPDPSRKRIIFHNPNVPNNVNILLSQTAVPNFIAPGGGFILFPGSNLQIDGDPAQGPWYVTAQSGANNAVTAITSMV